MNRRSAIQRLIGHIQFHLSGIMTAFRDSKDEIIDFQIDADLSNKMKELVQQLQDIEYSRAEPIFEPRRTMLICGTGKFAECNFLNAFLMRKYIKGTHYRMAKCGFNTYIVDYSTPFGYLALQVLNDLRECGERNHLYIFKSTVYSRQRKSYHLIPETDFERIVEESKADYNFTTLYEQAVVEKIYRRVGAYCKGTQIGVSRRHVPATVIKKIMQY